MPTPIWTSHLIRAGISWAREMTDLGRRLEAGSWSTGELPQPSGPAQSPPGGVFIDVQTLPQATASVKIEQVVLTGQYPPGATPDVRNATSVVATGINTISKNAETKTIDVTLGSSQKLNLRK